MEARIVEFPTTPASSLPSVGRTLSPIGETLPSVGRAPSPVGTALPPAGQAVVAVGPDRLVVERLVIVDPTLAAFVAERPEADRPHVVERAMRIGLLALQDAGTTLDVDVVRHEFEKLLRNAEQTNEKAAAALEQTLRANFADGDGRLPRTLERFLGDRGQLRVFVNELFDESKRDSAIGRMRQLLGTYFDGDASRLAQLLDPARPGAPLNGFRKEVADGFTNVIARIEALQAASEARATERAKSTAKGTDFEDTLESMLADLARGAGDILDRTGTATGDTLRSKKGDFVLTINEAMTRGAEVRIVVEAKDRAISGPKIREELREARRNRTAAIAVAVFSPQHAPTGVAPFDLRGGDVYCVIDPDAPDHATLEAAIRLARLLAVATLDDRDVEIDPAALSASLNGIREQLESIKGLKSQLTSIGNATKAVWTGLDTLRSGVLDRILEAEALLTPGDTTRRRT